MTEEEHIYDNQVFTSDDPRRYTSPNAFHKKIKIDTDDNNENGLKRETQTFGVNNDLYDNPYEAKST